MNTPHYELLQNISSLINIILIVVNDFREIKTADYIKYWMIAMTIINVIFLLESVVDIMVHGFVKAYSNHLRIYFETICQILNAYCIIGLFYDYDDL